MVMNVRMFFASEPGLGRRPGPTATEMSRVRHTEKMLIKSEGELSEKLGRARANLDLILMKDIQQHALEIHWGWDQLKSFVDGLPESCLDKAVWLEACIDGLARSVRLCEEAGERLSGRGISVWSDEVTFDGLSL